MLLMPLDPIALAMLNLHAGTTTAKLDGAFRFARRQHEPESSRQFSQDPLVATPPGQGKVHLDVDAQTAEKANHAFVEEGPPDFPCKVGENAVVAAEVAGRNTVQVALEFVDEGGVTAFPPGGHVSRVPAHLLVRAESAKVDARRGVVREVRAVVPCQRALPASAKVECEGDGVVHDGVVGEHQVEDGVFCGNGLAIGDVDGDESPVSLGTRPA